MTSNNDIEQNFEAASDRLDELLRVSVQRKMSRHTEAFVLTTQRDHSILSFVKETCNAEWMSQWAEKHPIPTFLFLNKIHDQLHKDSLWELINRAIQTSDVYQILQANHPAECPKYLNVQPLPKSELEDFTVLDFFDPASRQRRMSRSEKKPTFVNICDRFSAAANDFRTIKEVLDVRDEVRRRLVSQALISHDFKMKAAALAIGCKSDGALIGNVKALFRTSDYKRETIEPAITNWKRQTRHPFQPVIEDLVELGTLSRVEEQIQEFYPAIVMKAAEKCKFVKVRMADTLEVHEKTVPSLLAALGLEEWYVEAHKEFLKKTCDTAGHNYNKVATLLNVDVRYVVHQLSNYGIEKPSDAIQPLQPTIK